MSAGPTAVGAPTARVRARVEGVVQGVGFRPYVYRLAREERLAGWVLNDELGVLLEVEGEGATIERFLARLPAEAPPLATIERVAAEPVAQRHEQAFVIVQSARAGEAAALVSPDAATCADCLAELFDPADRRYRYPFINCTNCGPRFTIVRGVPYDRPMTTMAGFAMCPSCLSEYDDPDDRRFHAQPNACAVCGPSVRITDAAEMPVRSFPSLDPIAEAAKALVGGLIVAVKGLGGFHLACLAEDERAVARLRARKHREDRPFALMAPSLKFAQTLIAVDEASERLLSGRERPIVIARRRAGAPVAASVAPRSADLGVMLPYSPLHHVLLADVGRALVMTSGNVSDEPIAYLDASALRDLAGIADLFLVHDRPIHMRTDDSVVRARSPASRAAPLLMRRSRGYVPASIALPLVSRRPLLACGAELKSTFCVAKGNRAWVGHHIGDLKNYETLSSFREGIAHFERLFEVQPEIVAHDLHPDYLSSAYAHEREAVVLLGVQHHHAHLAACLAEHGETGPAIGAIYDGTGYGPDGSAWGGELLVGGLDGYSRGGHLRAVRLPGGDRAVQEPWRMACAWLVEALGVDVPALPAALAGAVEPKRWRAVASLARSGTMAPITTSAGRLFDAVAALCGVRAQSNYEAQAAVELEALARPGERGAYAMPVNDTSAGAQTATLTLDAGETVIAVMRDLADDVPVGTVAMRFHNALARATTEACITLADRHALGTVVLAGGVFQNRVLLERTEGELQRSGLRVLTPERLPPNDGAVAYGQAAVAALWSRAVVGERGGGQ